MERQWKVVERPWKAAAGQRKAVGRSRKGSDTGTCQPPPSAARQPEEDRKVRLCKRKAVDAQQKGSSLRHRAFWRVAGRCLRSDPGHERVACRRCASNRGGSEGCHVAEAGNGSWCMPMCAYVCVCVLSCCCVRVVCVAWRRRHGRHSYCVGANATTDTHSVVEEHGRFGAVREGTCCMCVRVLCVKAVGTSSHMYRAPPRLWGSGAWSLGAGLGWHRNAQQGTWLAGAGAQCSWSSAGVTSASTGVTSASTGGRQAGQRQEQGQGRLGASGQGLERSGISGGGQEKGGKHETTGGRQKQGETQWGTGIGRASRPPVCRGTWDPLVPCPVSHKLPRLPPENRYRSLRNFEGETATAAPAPAVHLSSTGTRSSAKNPLSPTAAT